jgi:hypothetical protein
VRTRTRRALRELHLSEELAIHREAAVEVIPRPRYQAHRKLSLKHEHRAPEGGHGQQHGTSGMAQVAGSAHLGRSPGPTRGSGIAFGSATVGARMRWGGDRLGAGRMESSLKTMGDEIWYGTLATQASKYGSSCLRKSAWMTSQFWEVSVESGVGVGVGVGAEGFEVGNDAGCGSGTPFRGGEHRQKSRFGAGS